MEITPESLRLANRISKRLEAEVLLICGSVDSEAVSAIVTQCEEKAKLPNVLLAITTLGGEPDSGYRLSRYLQSKFRRFSVFIPSICKSAGTLVAIGAHEVIVGPFGELGPLDVQFYKTDELDQISSGLVAQAAIASLETTAIGMFERYFLRLQQRTDGLITLKTAGDIAADIVAKLLNPVYAQINPFFIGDNDLAMRVAKDYGERLAGYSGNLKSPDALKALVDAYPAHDFVIDCAEAETIFNNIRAADGDLLAFASALGLPRLKNMHDQNGAAAIMMTGGGIKVSRQAVDREPSSTPAQLPEPIVRSHEPSQFHRVAKPTRGAAFSGRAHRIKRISRRKKV